jgi:hypothetical protein
LGRRQSITYTEEKKKLSVILRCSQDYKYWDGYIASTLIGKLILKEENIIMGKLWIGP